MTITSALADRAHDIVAITEAVLRKFAPVEPLVVGDEVRLAEGLYRVYRIESCPYAVAPPEYRGKERGPWVYGWLLEASWADSPLTMWVPLSAILPTVSDDEDYEAEVTVYEQEQP